MNKDEIKDIEETIDDVALEMYITSTNFKIIKSGNIIEVFIAEDNITDEERKELAELMEQFEQDEDE